MTVLPAIQTIILMSLVLISSFCISFADEISPETLFHQAVKAWQVSGTKNYKPFDQLAEELLQRFLMVAVESPDHRLPIVGAMEESILALERFIFEQQQGREEKVRDQTLSHLYLVYATALSQLSDVECKALALDPHTLLIGADTITTSSPASTFLCVENAENSARNAATLDATNKKAEALLEQLLPSNTGSVHERKPKEFVAELFDSFADTFDEKLLQGLEYKVPQMVGKLAQKMSAGKSFENALDAGCGTGLAGRYLRSMVQGKLIGVDASAKMLEIAKECTISSGCGFLTPEKNTASTNDDKDRPLYDDLLVLDLEEMTLENTLYRHSESASGDGFELIVAADVFVYFGSLEAVLETFATVSQVGAKLIFTCEKALPEEAPLGWRLLPSGRFAHTQEHVVEMAKKVGYRMDAYENIVPRMEKGEPVKGHLFGFVLMADDSDQEAIDAQEL